MLAVVPKDITSNHALELYEHFYDRYLNLIISNSLSSFLVNKVCKVRTQKCHVHSIFFSWGYVDVGNTSKFKKGYKLKMGTNLILFS